MLIPIFVGIFGFIGMLIFHGNMLGFIIGGGIEWWTGIWLINKLDQ